MAGWEIPAADRWTLLGSGRAYHDSHWLFQVALWAAYSSAGWSGVQGLVLAVWGLVGASLWRLARRSASVETATLVTTVALLACAERFLPRPEIATYAAFSWFLYAFASGLHERPRGLLKIAAVQVVWANSHGLFVLGPFVAFAFVLTSLRQRGERGWGLVRRILPVGIVSGATLVNPLGLAAWRYSLLLAREAGQSSAELIGSLGEMTSPFAASARSSPAIWTFYLLFAAALVAAARKLRRRELDADLLMAALCCGLALTGRRNVVLAAIAFVPLLASGAAAQRWPGRLATAHGRWAAAALLAGLCVFPLSGRYYLWMEIPARFGLGATPSFFPHSMAPALASGESGSRLLVSNTLGGFVSFHGAPRTLPLTDGRWEIYDGDELRSVLHATRTPGGWREIVARYRLDGLLLAHSSPEAAAILPELATDQGWRLAYLDGAASLWQPAGATRSPTPAPIAPAMSRFDDAILVATFASRAGNRELEIAALEKALALGWRGNWVREKLGVAQTASGRFDAAEVTFSALLANQPANATALNELAFLALRRGDARAAEAFLLRLLEAQPDHEAARANLLRVRERAVTEAGRSLPEK